MPYSEAIAHPLSRGLVLGAIVLVALALERWRPHVRLRPEWVTNLGMWATGTAVTALVCGACGWLVAGWAAERGLGLLAWLGAGPLVGVAAGVLGLDAVSYLWHRANHQLPLLWRFHEVHHTDQSFHVTTALRFHPGELLLSIPVRLAAIVALGVPAAGVLVFELVFGVANLLEHGNYDLPRRLESLARRLLITPTLHRQHHKADWRELNTNFGTVFSVWDRLGGTYHRGDAARVEPTGVPDPDPAWTRSLAESLLLPFRARRERAAGTGA